MNGMLPGGHKLSTGKRFRFSQSSELQAAEFKQRSRCAPVMDEKTVQLAFSIGVRVFLSSTGRYGCTPFWVRDSPLCLSMVHLRNGFFCDDKNLKISRYSSIP